nr:TauD/TfdA family dioxygenase [Pseudomonas sp.]
MLKDQVLPIFDTPQAWLGASMAQSQNWVYEFTQADIDELEAATMPLDASGAEILEIQREHFPLPKLSKKLAEWRGEVLHGRGFQLLRGIPLQRYTFRQAAIMYWGIGLHIGQLVSQNGKGHLLGHVTNLGLNYADPEVRGYQTNARLPYHSDASDIVSLLCVQSARSGGLSSLVSSTTVWNEMVKRDPDSARTLLRPLYYTRWGEIPEGKKPYEAVPVFAPYDGRMITSYVRSAVYKAQALPGVPPLTDAQIKAMDLLDELSADPELHLDMTFEPGDIQLVSNYSVFHSRTTYEDWPEPERRRHLLRLWLACDDGPALPDFLYERLGTTPSGRPDGIRVPGVPLIAPLQAA